MKYQSVITDIKVSLFDVHDLFDHGHTDINTIMESFHCKMKETMGADDAKIYLNRNKLAYFISSRNLVALQSLMSTDKKAYHAIRNLFQSDKDVVISVQSDAVTGHEGYGHHLVMRLNTATNFSGFYVFSYENKPDFTAEIIQEIQQVIDKHFVVISNYFRERFMKERNQLLFQLSANLHSIHSTTEVLTKVHQTVKKIYPRFNYRFLMSHEFENTNTPIFTLIYSEKNDRPETIAFINNEIQFDYNQEKDMTVAYSPLAGKQGVYGVLEIEIPGQVYFVDEDIQFIIQASKMIGQAVERTTLYQSSTQLVTDLQFINIASRDLNKNLDRSEISENVIKHIVSSCQTEEIGIILFPEHEESDTKFVVTKESTSYFKSGNAEPFIYYLYERLQENGDPILSGNFKVDSLVIPFTSIMVIPMWDSEKIFGIIIIAHEEPYYFSFDKYRFVQSFIQHAALAYTNSMLKEKLRQIAITDHLTKLYLRNHLDKKIDEHMKSDRGGSFILLDVDDFKLVNDTHGHYVGDKVLIQIANVIKEAINETGIGARWGGEEFAVYIPYANEDYAQEIASTIRNNVKGQTNPQVTVSIGISSWHGKDKSIEQLFIKADEALYEAKSAGKNRIIIS